LLIGGLQLQMPRLACRSLLTLGVLVLSLPLAAFQAERRSQPVAPKKGDSKINPKDGLRYRWIPPGTYTYGCSTGDKQCFTDEYPQRKITLTRGFWLGETEVPQSAWAKVMPDVQDPSDFVGEKLPVNEATYYDASDYCAAVGGRLPTDAEWEYAARAGSAAARYGDLDKIAWYVGNSNDTPHPVAQKQPNAFGLYDMLGNVIEWTDTYFTVQLSQENIDPKGPREAEYRTLRGGGWFDDPELVRASDKSWFEDGDTDYNVGFRCAMDQPRPQE
jgi:formylglycine-generating enzyme required for sulfatase activity